MNREIEKLLKEVAEEEDISELMAKDIYTSIFLISKNLMQTPEMPKVKLHNFGTFYASKTKIDKFLERRFSQYKEGKVTRERMCELVEKYWPVRRRLQQELKSAKHRNGFKL